MRELGRLVARARFEIERTASVCDAVPTKRIVHAAPRRRKQVVAEQPCGLPVDKMTDRLATCARTLLAPISDERRIGRCRL